MSKDASWYVDINKIRTDYPVIENLKQFLADSPPILPKYHPDYIKYWSKETKKCIEGVWGSEFGKYRYMPGNLYFFGSFTVLEDSKDVNGVRVTKRYKPKIVDYIWEFSYQSWAAYGFSGFELDEEYTCNIKAKDYWDGRIDKQYLPEQCIKPDGEVKEFEEAYDYLHRLHKKKLGKSLFQNPARDSMTLGTRGGCHQKGTLIRMFDGTLSKVEDIKEGDLLMGIDSAPRKVLNLGRGFDDFFEVNQKHGDTYYINKDHIIPCFKKSALSNILSGISNSRKEHVEYLTAQKLYEYQQTHSHRWTEYIGYTSCAVEYPEKELKYDPYWVGLWLGDGFKREKMICVSPAETEIMDWLKNYCNDNDWTYSIKESKSGLVNSTTYRFSLLREDERKKNSYFAKTLRNNKHIPNEYMINSKGNRLKLLAGMIDSDGHYEEKAKRFTIANTDFNLLRQFQLLAKSLGFKAVINKPYITGIADSLKYSLRIYGNITEIPTLLPRKKAISNSRIETGFNKISKKGTDYNVLKLTPVPKQEFYGFEVDKDNLYLLEDYTVTHNSKSYWVGLGEFEYNFVFGGHRRYDNDFIRGVGSSSRQVVGSADTTKSSDLLDKFKRSQDAKTENKNDDFVKWFGIYTETYLDAKGNTKERITPCPFYKKSMGNLDCPNKDNSYKALYKINVNGEYKPKGSGNELVHVNYSSKKADGHTAGVGGRYLFSNVEEVGLVQNYTGILGAMDSAMKRQTKEGVQHAQGTSGFIEYVQEAKKVFLCPDDYGMVGYKNVFSSSGTNNKICYFLPNYITQFDCKDENGNTQYDKVLEKVNRKREEKAKSGDPKVLRDHLMNEPCYVEEMWLTDKGYYLPYEEASLRERELLQFGLYKSLMNPVELYWDDTKPNKVNYKILHDANPYTDFPHDFSKRRDPSGCVVIYEFPEEAAPDDLYIITLDPYIAEELDKGGSVGAAHVWKKSKYISSGIAGNTLVATYIGKPEKGLDYYHEQLEKLVAFYGNPTRGIWFEKNRGEAIREYFIRRGKADLLCITPQFKQGTHIYQKNVLSYGFLVGNQVSKLQLLKGLNDWCLEETEFNKHGIVENKINIARIPCIYTIRQMMQYKLDGNFDAVSSCLGMPLAFGEEKAMLEQHLRRKEKDSNSFNYLLQNKRIFHASGNKVKSFR